jgi:hypothetical protein
VYKYVERVRGGKAKSAVLTQFNVRDISGYLRVCIAGYRRVGVERICMIEFETLLEYEEIRKLSKDSWICLNSDI